MMVTSASQYGAPYTYKEPPPKIKYPPMFSGLNDITFKYAFDSKLLALATLLLLVSVIVNVGMAVMPFWFELVLGPVDGTFGSMQLRPRTIINCGIFYLREDQFDNLAFLQKYNNVNVVPSVLGFAQVCAVLGHCILGGGLAAAVILMLRQFGSVTGLVMLAAAISLGAVLEVLACVFSMFLVLTSTCDPDDSGCVYTDNLEWHQIPMYSQMYRVEPTITPMVTANWGLYIAWIGAALSFVSAILLWLEARSTGNTLQGIRYEQLKQTIDPFEGDINPNSGRKYVYAEPDCYGPGVYGMQPVVQPQFAPGPQIGFANNPAAVSYAPGPSRYERDSETSSYYTESSFNQAPTPKRIINI